MVIKIYINFNFTAPSRKYGTYLHRRVLSKDRAGTNVQSDIYADLCAADYHTGCTESA